MRSFLPLLAVLSGCVSHAGGTRPEPGQPAPTYVDARTLCPNVHQMLAPFPGEAVAANIRAGQVTLEFDPRFRGSPRSLKVVQASHQVFVEPALRAARQLDCRASPSGLPVRITVEFNNGGD